MPRGAGPPQSRADAGVTLCRPLALEVFSTLYHPSVTSWPRAEGTRVTLSLPEAPQPLAPMQAPPSTV